MEMFAAGTHLYTPVTTPDKINPLTVWSTIVCGWRFEPATYFTMQVVKWRLFFQTFPGYSGVDVKKSLENLGN